MRLRDGVITIATVFVAGWLTGCSDESQSTSPTTPSSETVFSYNSAPVLQHYLALGNEVYLRALASTKSLRSAIDALIQSPSEQSLTDARAAWLKAHGDYQASEVFNFRNRLNPLGGKDYSYEIDGWPIQPGLIDYVKGYPYSGFIHHPSLPINEESLRLQNGATDLEEVSLGFHAMEFMLWGDDSESPRTFKDFIAVDTLNADQKEQGYTVADVANNRRRLYLTTLAEILDNDLKSAAEQWAPNQQFYQQHLFKLDNKKQFSLVLRSVYGWVNDFLTNKHLKAFAHLETTTTKKAKEKSAEEADSKTDSSEHPIQHSPFSQQDIASLIKATNSVIALLVSPTDGVKQGLDTILQEAAPEQAKEIEVALQNLMVQLEKANKEDKGQNKDKASNLNQALSTALQLEQALVQVGNALDISLNAQQFAASN